MNYPYRFESPLPIHELPLPIHESPLPIVVEFMNYPVGHFIDNHNSVKMVGHDNRRSQCDRWITHREEIPHTQNDFTRLTQIHHAIPDFAKQAFPAGCHQCNKICAGLRIIILRQTDGSALLARAWLKGCFCGSSFMSILVGTIHVCPSGVELSLIIVPFAFGSGFFRRDVTAEGDCISYLFESSESSFFDGGFSK